MAEPPAPISPEEFFRLVEQYLTSPMAAHGYVVCGGGESKGSDPLDTGSVLTRVPAWRSHPLVRSLLRRRYRHRLVRQFSVGYEGDSDDEYWVTYLPERRGLDLVEWRDVLRGHLDIDADTSEPIDREEVRRRLRLLGEAVAAAETLGPG